MDASSPSHTPLDTEARPRYRAVQPGQSPSYWQPGPANGYAEVLLEAGQTVSGNIAMGTQTVAPGCFVREHAHPAQEELIFVLAGEGVAVIEEIEHPMVPGTLLYLGPRARHKFTNTGTTPLTFAWTMVPGGLERFFAAIGRPRAADEPAPPPFPRPDDVKSIELGTVFVDLGQRSRGRAD